MATKSKPVKKKVLKAEMKQQPLPPGMSFEQAVALSIKTKMPKKTPKLPIPKN
jgi:hypothetical protein